MPTVKNLLGFTAATCKNSTKMYPVPKESPFKTNLLDDKVALITAGNSPLSRVMAQCFAEHSATVVIAERKAPPIKTAKLISQIVDKEIGAVRIDPCNETSINEVFDYIEKAIGRKCNVLINHCPLQFTAPSDQVTIQDIQLSCDAIATAAFLMTKSLYARNANTIPTSVLNITSNFAQSAIPFAAVTSMALAAVEAMTRSLSNEFAKGGLRINTLAPNAPFLEENNPKNMQHEEVTCDLTLPIGRSVLLSELAYAAVYMCSSYANPMTGSCITIDGGQRHVLHPNNLLHGLNENEWKEIVDKQRELAAIYKKDG